MSGLTEAFSGTYAAEDVVMLLKPADIAPTPVAEKERLIQSGVKHYSEMLSAEAVPDARYMQLYHDALARNAGRLKNDIATLAQKIAARPQTQAQCVIISLARAGTPIGVLVKRALERLGVTAFHYTVSIIRGRGIDLNALRAITARHGTASAIFLDGWTGKGAISRELETSLAQSDLGFAPFLAVVADPAGTASLAATTDDYVIPSGLLNGIVSGLISRTVLTDTLVGPNDFHACLFQQDQAPYDLTHHFLEAVEGADTVAVSVPWSPEAAKMAAATKDRILRHLADTYQVTDINRIKPGIAEATRATLRRLPERVLVRDLDDPETQHLRHLAEKDGVPVMERDLGGYRAVTIIRNIKGEQE
ncbi:MULTISPECIES: cysteine protease StiP family protein [Asticcacaulis]|uniref:cysteine protease StiP family protein n=1 Tax=Asticcacaulis TaxID=76890 RepID=UPI001AE500C8|nr:MULTISPECIES: cysteine protease StiP family protein [Asticcacaulis]MBP2157804.1 hypothetical protein [Asticcacaulis solisilvae]MDR6798849.1 hypothetical protein [Asticcacaulis sp. BE141]